MLFANLANNLEATGRSYFNHRNTPDYDRMLTALKCAAGAKTPCAFEEAKRQIARTSEDYLRGKPDLGTASSFHPKSELRRKCAYLAVAIADPEAGKALAIESDRFRRGDDRIRFGRLAAMPGVGTVNAQVRNIRVEDIAAGNQQNNNGNDRRRIEQGADHRRNLAAHQRQNNDQNGPVAAGSNNH